MSDIGVKELRQVKGLGPKKAATIAAILSDETTIEELQAIRGVSANLANEVIQLRDSGGEPVKPVKRTRKRAAKKTTASGKITAHATRNGDSNGRIALTAGTLRKVARSIADADPEEAQRLRSAVSDLLDPETVPQDRFA